MPIPPALNSKRSVTCISEQVYWGLKPSCLATWILLVDKLRNAKYLKKIYDPEHALHPELYALCDSVNGGRADLPE